MDSQLKLLLALCASVFARTLEILDLFPRSIFKGQLPEPLLNQLLSISADVLAHPGGSPDASAKLAGQLSQQRELSGGHSAIQQLCSTHVLPACDRWIAHVMGRQPPQGRGPWVPGRYQLQMVDLWLNCQRAGDYNPTHTHGGSFSGVIFLKVPPQINGQCFDGQLCFHGPEDWHLQSFRTGMAHYVLPVPGEFYVFPAWQPHSVAPFRGDGDRWSIAFNVLAVPLQASKSVQSAGVSTQQRFGTASPRRSQSTPTNVSLSSRRTMPRGF